MDIHGICGVVGSPGDNFGFTLGSPWWHFVITVISLESLRGHSGVTLGSLWYEICKVLKAMSGSMRAHRGHRPDDPNGLWLCL